MDNIKIRATLDEHLKVTIDDMVRLSSKVDTAIDKAINAFASCDVEVGQQVIAQDTDINAKRFELEEHCLHIMVTQQPVAVDLRLIIATMNIVTELERIGDYAAGIAKLAVRVELYPKRDIPNAIYQLTSQCRDMLRRAMVAYTEHDASLAYAVADNDDSIDNQYKLLFQKLVGETRDASHSTDHLLSVLFVAHNLERIGDRATNIAERVIFMTSGKLTELNI
jgi:phosphate transport system protein